MKSLVLLNQKQICHGNIKLSNIVLFPKKFGVNDSSDDITRSNTFTYKLIDYSISHKYKQRLMGMTKLYASPELKMGYEGRSANIDYFKSNIYAVGIVCLKLRNLTSEIIQL